jgi:UDP-N-acetyl-D-glucosamine dehydrogenase
MTDFERRVESRDVRVGIVGMGYVGLPLAFAFSAKGFPVTGVDIDPAKVDALRAGQSYIKHIPKEQIAALNDSGGFEATTDMGALAAVDAILLCVPTPLTAHREPDMSYVVATTEAVAAHLRPGQLVVLESTTYPGTTREVMVPILERQGLRHGVDFFVAYSPEREDPGNAEFTTARIPKVVGGCTEEGGRRAARLYEQIVPQVVVVSSAETAEAVKLTENIFRCVNIALVNELKLVFSKMGIDVWEVIDAAKTKPFGYMPFYPGPGLGGHCIPIDPFYLTWKAREFGSVTRFIELAGEINVSMPDHVVHAVMEALNDCGKALKGSRILILGLSYKKDVDDLRESPSLVLMELLSGKGAAVDFHDPYVDAIKATRKHPALTGRASVALNRETLGGYDAVLISTDHSCIDYHSVVAGAQLVVDTRNATKDVTEGREKIVKA